MIKSMLIIANWKAYVDSLEKAKKLFALSKRLSIAIKRVKIVLAPSAPYLGLLAKANRSRIAFAGQDISITTIGAATGEVSGSALKSAGASHVIVGHSERRAMGETDEMVSDKVRRALANGLVPIVCVGERERDHDAQYLRFIKKQIATVYEPLKAQERLKIVIAYEPVWAIGKSASEALPERDLAEMVLYIRKVLGEYLMSKSVEMVPVLYGGSVEVGNIRDLAGGSAVDGFLVGHASVNPDTFSSLVKELK